MSSLNIIHRISKIPVKTVAFALIGVPIVGVVLGLIFSQEFRHSFWTVGMLWSTIGAGQRGILEANTASTESKRALVRCLIEITLASLITGLAMVFWGSKSQSWFVGGSLALLTFGLSLLAFLATKERLEKHSKTPSDRQAR